MPKISWFRLVQCTLEAWLECQAGWVYLEPIFGSDDIMQQMPNEGRKFRSVDTSWRLTMQRLKKNPEVITVAADAELLRTLQEANALIEQVWSGTCACWHACADSWAPRECGQPGQ